VKHVETFVAERRASWARLGALLDRAERVTDRELGRASVLEMVTLYRQASADLNRARSLTANPELLSELNALTGRAYRFIYRGARRASTAAAMQRFLLVEVPAAMRRQRGHVLAAALSLLLGVGFGFGATWVDPGRARLLIPAMFFTESPRERVEKIENGKERIDSMEKALAFGSNLYVHNIQVAFLAFSLAALTIAGGHLVLFTNGVVLGAVAALYHLEGVATFFYAWVGPHGALEIPAIVLAAAAGLVLGRALLFPGESSRADSVRSAQPDAARMLVTSMLVLVGAGLVEGSFSQVTAHVVPFAVKIAVALLLFTALVSWLFLARSKGEA